MQVYYTPQALKHLEQLPPSIAKRIVDKMEWFVVQDSPLSFAKRLVDMAEETWRFRIGDYRALCRLKNGTLQILEVLAVKHRREVYRGL